MLTVFSDLHCPWAYVFTIRMRRARAAVGRPPVAWRCWPLELVNDRGTPWETVSQEVPVLTQLEPDRPGSTVFAELGAFAASVQNPARIGEIRRVCSGGIDPID